MAEWYENPYKGGPMAIPADYFPRPLYPPDANHQGKKPSKDGPDVEAYKRTICRLGRWGDWDPPKWDRAYNNNFSHGKGTGNVADSGIAGFQRQMNIDDTGWVGPETFNKMASSRVPKGPHEGEMAMDALACNLIGEAFGIYGGKAEKPLPPPTSKTRDRALSAAVEWINYVEEGSNDTIFGRWYGMNYQPWCAMFVSYCYEVEAGGSPSFKQCQAYAYCPYIVQDARANRNGLSVTGTPLPGDLVLFDWGWDGVHDHIGMFESGSSTHFKTIEGNTSTSNQSNGGQVMRRDRSKNDAGIVFVRVAEP